MCFTKQFFTVTYNAISVILYSVRNKITVLFSCAQDDLQSPGFQDLLDNAVGLARKSACLTYKLSLCQYNYSFTLI